MTAKQFPTLVVASAITGVGLCHIPNGYSKMMEVASHLLGTPVWLHELAHGPTQDAYSEEGYRQFPDMPTKAEAKADWQAAAAKALAAYGETVTVRQGTAVRLESPVQTLKAMVSPDKIITVITGDE